ncbi:MAG: hypothetical protein E7336_04455 [Clostridiales bacterium]|nr:hypothetical protein [Clostridiales bacterium]
MGFPVRLEGGRAMMFAQKHGRLLGMALILLVLVFSLGIPAAMAVEDPIDFTIQVEPQSLTEPGAVKVSLRVANTGSEDMKYPVELYDPAGNLVSSFGDGGTYLLKAGAFRTWEGNWDVTQAELDAGEFSYTLKYHLEDENGELVEFSRQAVARVEFTGERVKLTISRSITPEVVRSGSQATVVYELYNSGNVDLKDIRVKEKISRNAQTVKTLAVGEKTTLTFTSRIGNADLVSSAEITYKAANAAKTYTEKVEEAAILLAKPNLKIELSTTGTGGVNIGEAATLVVTFTNAGNVSYSNVTVTDASKGEIFTNLAIPAGATVVEEKEFILMEPTTFKVTASLPDNTGETRSLNAVNELTIGVFDPEKTLLLTLNLTCDQEAIHQTPADVRFNLTVTNNSNIKAEKIAIYHGSTYVTTISALEPGASTVITRDFTVSQAGKFRFTASLKDSLQNTVTFDSNTLQIIYAQATPVPTQVPVVTIAPPELMTAAPADPIMTQARSALKTLGAILGVIFLAVFALFAVSTIVRLYKKGKSKAAYDHLELAERRDYTEPADEELEEVEARVEETYRAEEEAELLPHEKLVKPIVESAAPADAPAVEEMPASDGEGGYRVSRAVEDDDAPVLDVTEEDVAAEAAAPVEERLAAAHEAAKESDVPRRRRSRRAQRTEDGE